VIDSDTSTAHQAPATAAGASRILVTGGAGFIGSHVVDALRREGYVPRIFDLRRSSHHARGEVQSVIGDLGDSRALTRAMAGCDVVVHLAAAADVGEVVAAPVDAERRNASGTLNVLESARQTGVSRVVYASTVWVYSDVACDEVDEDTPLRPPAHLYTATKLAGELYCHAYHELYGVEYTVLRFGIPYGPRARPAAVIPSFVTRALAGEPLTIAGDGQQSRALVYVEDLAAGVVAALAPVAANRTYNLATRDEVTVVEIAETVQAVVGPVPIEHAPGRSGDFRGTEISSERAAIELGWRAATTFGEGVRRYVDWHQTAQHSTPARPNWWRARALPGTVLAGLAALIALMALAAIDPLSDLLGRAAPMLWSVLFLIPLAVAGTRARAAVCWSLAAAELAVAILPWPGALGRVGHTHLLMLLVGASIAVVVELAGRGGLLRPAPERP
jgi:UDP-glucose 4-epimerase